jgi:hypothetical protein
VDRADNVLTGAVIDCLVIIALQGLVDGGSCRLRED